MLYKRLLDTGYDVVRYSAGLVRVRESIQAVCDLTLLAKPPPQIASSLAI